MQGGELKKMVIEAYKEADYSGSPAETFFTGSGQHTFGNFDATDNSAVLTVRQATWRSTNLVFIRLMRDLVRYHTARLPYDAEAVLEQPDHPDRARRVSGGDPRAPRPRHRSQRPFRPAAPDHASPGRAPPERR